eukprot:COSAG05_NODE_6504_length_946_cov_1.395514_2_plen_93_part_00
MHASTQMQVGLTVRQQQRQPSKAKGVRNPGRCWLRGLRGERPSVVTNHTPYHGGKMNCPSTMLVDHRTGEEVDLQEMVGNGKKTVVDFYTSW